MQKTNLSISTQSVVVMAIRQLALVDQDMPAELKQLALDFNIHADKTHPCYQRLIQLLNDYLGE